MPENPLTQSDLDDINQSIRELDEAMELMDTAARGGIDVTEERREAQETKAKLLRLKQAFFPGQ